jgi:transposase
MEDWITIKNLKARNPDISLREIARKLGVDHHTVKAALARESPPEYARRENPLLVPFKEVIFEMLNVKHFKGSRILEELRSKGYTGGKTALYSYLDRMRIDQMRHFTPYETRPGEQSQFDWTAYTVLMGGELVEVTIFSYINSFSRTQIFEGSLIANQGAVLEAMEASIIQSGGVPQRMQTDNSKVFVTNASRTNFQWNPRYLHFCAHYGFEPTRSLPLHPWSKGKVEKPFQYLEDHFIRGGVFEDFEDFIKQLKAFQQKVNQRVHATTKMTPEQLIVKDCEAFSPLPATGYVGVREEIRQVTFDCLLSFGGSRYSVPWMFAGKQVWIRVSRGYYLEIYSQASKLIWRHKLATTKGSVVIVKEHYRAFRKDGASFDRLKVLFREAFPAHELFVEKLQAQKRSNAHRHLYQFLELAKLYGKEEMIEAIRVCLEYNVFNGSFISGFLEKNFQQSFTLPPQVRHYQLTLEPLRRDLREYQLNQPSNTHMQKGEHQHATDTARQLPQDAVASPDQGDLFAGGGERSEH